MIEIKTFAHDLLPCREIETKEGPIRIYKTPDGDFPSMTSILSQLDDGGINAWIEYVGKEEADRIVKESITRGNCLHELSEDYLLNRFSRDKVKGQGGILFNRAKHLLDKIQIVHAIEYPLWSKSMRYAGRADGIVKVNNELSILDHKNSRKRIDLKKSSTRKKLFGYMLQCTGYSLALYEQTGMFASHGHLIISDMETLSSQEFRFKINNELINELDILIRSFYAKDEDILKQSMYFSL